MARYTQAEKEEILNSRLPGESLTAMSVRVKINKSTLYHWLKPKTAFSKMKIDRQPSDFLGVFATIHLMGADIVLHQKVDPSYIRSLLL